MARESATLTGEEKGSAVDLRLIVAPAWPTSATLQGKRLAEECTRHFFWGRWNSTYKQPKLRLAELHLKSKVNFNLIF